MVHDLLIWSRNDVATPSKPRALTEGHEERTCGAIREEAGLLNHIGGKKEKPQTIPGRRTVGEISRYGKVVDSEPGLDGDDEWVLSLGAEILTSQRSPWPVRLGRIPYPFRYRVASPSLLIFGLSCNSVLKYKCVHRLFGPKSIN